MRVKKRVARSHCASGLQLRGEPTRGRPAPCASLKALAAACLKTEWIKPSQIYVGEDQVVVAWSSGGPYKACLLHFDHGQPVVEAEAFAADADYYADLKPFFEKVNRIIDLGKVDVWQSEEEVPRTTRAFVVSPARSLDPRELKTSVEFVLEVSDDIHRFTEYLLSKPALRCDPDAAFSAFKRFVQDPLRSYDGLENDEEHQQEAVRLN